MAHPTENMLTKGHWAVGVEWPVVDSKGDQYTVTLLDRGWECSCPAYRMCKHIKGVEAKFLGEENVQFQGWKNERRTEGSTYCL